MTPIGVNNNLETNSTLFSLHHFVRRTTRISDKTERTEIAVEMSGLQYSVNARFAKSLFLAYNAAQSMSQLSPSELALLPTGRHNWAEAFTHYCSGLQIEDIATMMNIPLDKLETKFRSERWPMMKAKVEAQAASLVPIHPDEMARRANLVQANREKNHELWVKLRGHAEEVINTLIDTKGKAMFKRYWHNKGMIVEHECDVSLSELNALANYLQVIAQGTYAALGDRISSSGAKDDATSSPGGSGVPTIQIILPGVIAQPRHQRSINEVKVHVSERTPIVDV